MQDLRFAFRMLMKKPGFTATVLLVLALGIGANATMFTLVNAVLLRGLPFPNGDRILHISSSRPAEGRTELRLSLAEVRQLRQLASFEALAAFQGISMNVSDPENMAERYIGSRASSNLLALTTEKPILGRLFTDGEDKPGAAPVVVIGYGMWQKRYGGRPDVLGKILRVNDVPATIIGVMPQGFQFPIADELWIPLIPDEALEKPETRVLQAIGLVKPGVAVDQAKAEVGTLSKRLAVEWAQTNREVQLVPLRYNELFGNSSTRLFLLTLTGAVCFVLLIACANVANLMLGQSIARTREVSIRMAMGANRWHIVRQMLIESMVLGLLGGLGGFLFGLIGVRLFDLAASEVGKPYWIIFRMDWQVFSFLAGICLLTSVLFGSAPAWQLARTPVSRNLKETGRSVSAGVGMRRLSGSLVVMEIALALALLAAAGLMIRSFLKSYEMNATIPSSHILTMRVRLPESKYPNPARRIAFWDQLLPRLRNTPGVEAITLSSVLPLQGGNTWNVQLEGQGDQREYPRVTGIVAGVDYFRVLGQQVAGRSFEERDGDTGHEVAIVNRSFAARFWPNQDVLGRRIKIIPEPGQRERPWLTIIGVTPDIVQTFPKQDAEAVVYLPYRHEAGVAMGILARSSVPPGTLADAFRKDVRSTDENLPVFLVQTMSEAEHQARWGLRVFGTLFTVFALVALVLSSVGLYGVTAYAVSQRTQEFGVRLAVGATTGDILRLVFRQGLIRLAIGTVLGLAVAFGTTRFMKSFLVTTPTEPLTYLVILAVLSMASLLACWIPARRAMSVDPIITLRWE